MVFMEDLDYRTMAKGMFGKHMLDAGLDSSAPLSSMCVGTEESFSVKSTLGRLLKSALSVVLKLEKT
jgi:hypothetical protein